MPLLKHAPDVLPPAERISTPGAVTATPAPRLLKPARLPLIVDAATANAPRQLAGALLDTSALLLPAATTGKTPRAISRSNAS